MAIVGASNKMLESYQFFTFDKSMMKRLYFQEKEPTVDDELIIDSNLKNENRSDKEEFLHSVENRKSYEFSYCHYITTLIQLKCVNCCSCCFCCKKVDLESRRMKRFKKF